MAINFLVALRVAEYAATPLRRVAESGNLLGDAAQRLSVQVRSANAALVTFAAGADALGIAISSSAAKLEEKIARLATATETTTASMSSSLENAKVAAKKFSENYSVSAEEVVGAQFRLATAGVAVNEQIDAVQGAFKLSIATMGDFTDASELLGSFLNTFGKSMELNYLAPFEKVEKITDIATLAVQRYQLDLDNLNDSLKFLVGPASTLNLPTAEVFAFAGALNTAGFKGTLAGTAISNAYNKINQAIEKLDLDPTRFTDASGNLKDFASFLDEVARKTEHMTSLERQSKFIEVFDIRAGRAINTLLGVRDATRQFVAEADLATGATQELANIMEDTTNAKLKHLLNVLNNVSTTIGGELNNSLKVVLDSFKSGAQAVSIFVEEHKTLISSVIGIGAVVLTATAAITSFSFIIGKMGTALSSLAASSSQARIALLPLQGIQVLGTALIGIVGTIGALHLLRNGVQEVANAFDAKSFGEGFIQALIGIAEIGTSIAIGFVAWPRIVSAATSVFNVFGRAINFVRPAFIFLAPIGAMVANSFRFLRTVVIGAISAIGMFQNGILLLVGSLSTLTAGLGMTAAAVTVLTGVTAGIGLIAVAAYGIYSLATSKSAKSTEELKNKTIEFKQELGNVLTLSAKYAAELDRLSKTVINDVNPRLKPNQLLGELPFAREATKTVRDDPTIRRADAINQSVEKIGGLTGIMKQYAIATGQSARVTQDYVNAMDKILVMSDSTYSALDSVSKAQRLVRTQVEGSIIAIDALSGGSQQAAESLKRLIELESKNRAGKFEKNDLLAAFEAIDLSLPELLKTSNERVANLVKRFGDLKTSVKDFGAESNSFQNFIGAFSSTGALQSIVSEFNGMIFAASRLGVSLNAIQNSTHQLKTNISSINQLFKNAELGGNSYADAIQKSSDRLIEAKSQLNNILQLTKEIESQRDFFKSAGLEKTEAFKDIEKILNQKYEIEIDLRTGINEAEITIVENKFKSLLDTTTNTFLVASRKTLSEGFTSVVSDALVGKIQGQNVFGSLADSFKKQFITKIQGDISLSLGDKFKGEFQAAIDSANQVIANAQIGDSIFRGIQTGELANQINDAVKAVTPQLQRLGLGDIFNLKETSKLAETFNDIFTEASVKMITATSSGATALQQLQRIISQPISGFDQLTDQATRLQELLIRANNQGATDAIRPIEEALKATLSQLRQDQPNGPAQQLLSASQQVEGTISTVTNRFASAIAEIVPAARSFIGTIEDGFKRIREQGLPSIAANSPIQTGNDINFKVEHGVKNFNISISGNTSSNSLDEFDIQKIVDQAKDELMKEYNETIRQLEERLRNR